MKTKKTAITAMVLTFLTLLVIDLVSTLMLGDLVVYLEANPMFKYIGIFGIIGVNFIIIAVVYWLYQRSNKPATRYYYINLLVTICLTRILVIINNIEVFLDPPTLQQAMDYAASATVSSNSIAVAKFAWISIIPYFIGIVAFWIWSLDHKVDIKEV